MKIKLEIDNTLKNEIDFSKIPYLKEKIVAILFIISLFIIFNFGFFQIANLIIFLLFLYLIVFKIPSKLFFSFGLLFISLGFFAAVTNRLNLPRIFAIYSFFAFVLAIEAELTPSLREKMKELYFSKKANILKGKTKNILEYVLSQ